MTAGWTVPAADPHLCVLCQDTADVSLALMRFRDRDDEGNVFSHGPRCRDHRACRERYETATGDVWPLEDGTR